MLQDGDERSEGTEMQRKRMVEGGSYFTQEGKELTFKLRFEGKSET